MCQPYNHKLSFEVTLLNLPNFMTLIALLSGEGGGGGGGGFAPTFT